ncbi:hypothetical protein BDQ94DRAFT_139193, partial [Aspergillus welwitschiae]
MATVSSRNRALLQTKTTSDETERTHNEYIIYGLHTTTGFDSLDDVTSVYDTLEVVDMVSVSRTVPRRGNLLAIHPPPLV